MVEKKIYNSSMIIEIDQRQKQTHKRAYIFLPEPINGEFTLSIQV